MTGLEVIVPLVGMLAPPVVDFFKKKFIKRSDDTIEATAGTLATTAPDRLPEYISSMVSLIKARIEGKNWDVVGTPSQIIIDIRAGIRPVTVIVSLLILAVDHSLSLNLDPPTRTALLTNISNWFGTRW